MYAARTVLYVIVTVVVERQVPFTCGSCTLSFIFSFSENVFLVLKRPGVPVFDHNG